MVSIWMGALLAIGLTNSPVENTKADAIQCDVQIIHAKKESGVDDPALEPISRYLKRSFGSRYRSFKQITRTSMRLRINNVGTEALPNKTTLRLKYLGSEENLLRLEMSVGDLKTNVKVHNGGLFFQAGRSYRNGMLIVAIRVKKDPSQKPMN